MKIDVGGHTVKYSDGLLSVYNSKGLVIHQVSSSGMKYWWDYDENGHEIYRKDSNGYEKWTDYDHDGHGHHYKDSNGYEEWVRCTPKGKLISFKDSDGHDEFNIYDSTEHMLYHKAASGKEYWYNIAGYEVTKQEFDKLYDNNGALRQMKVKAQTKKCKPSKYECLLTDSLGNITYIKEFKGETWSKFCGTTLVYSLHSWGEQNWYNPTGKVISKEEFDKIYDTQYVLRK